MREESYLLFCHGLDHLDEARDIRSINRSERRDCGLGPSAALAIKLHILDMA